MSEEPAPEESLREGPQCLDEEQILRVLEGGIEGAERDAIEAHLDGCAACRRLVAAAAPTDDRRSRSAGGDRSAGVVLGRGASIGRYLVLSLLGRGGMGVVYAAYDAELDRKVALKLLHAARGSEAARRIMVREARALGKLSHPNVVQVHDVGERDGDVFVAMELVEGRSLDAWCLGHPPPRWREVLGAYLAAARGLAAAHAKGLVHRDVKPANILRGDDGRVRVVDFGLAAGLAGEERAPPSRDRAAAPLDETVPAPSDERLTPTGALVGTPLYMAPEQHLAPRTTAASDQYSLCVALHEGLYGVPPFAIDPRTPPGKAPAQLLQAKEAGPPASPPAGSAAPPWVYRAIARGLAPAPEDRWPSMNALIDALGDDPEARRRSRLRRGGAAVVGAALLAIAAAGWARSGAFRDPCAHPEQTLAGVWDGGVKERVRAALLGTKRPYAEATMTRVSAVLDDYAASYAAMRGEVCKASQSGRQRAEITVLREACLDRRRGQLHALTGLLAEKPDPDVLDRAVQAASSLHPVAYCADTEALTARVRPPEDPAVRARVAALEPRVDRLEALQRAGKYKEGVALAGPLLDEVMAVPYAPLRARAQYAAARVEDGAGDFEGARALLRDAAVSAAEGHDDLLAANAWSVLLLVVADRQRRFEEATLIRSLGAAAIARADDDAARALWASSEGIALLRMGNFAEAKVAQERALALRERVFGPDHPDVAGSLHNLATVTCNLGDCLAARGLLERAVAISERTLGPEHPDTAMSLGNLAIVLRRIGDYQGAVAVNERVIAIKERALGPEHRSVAASLNNLGNALFDLGELSRSASALERALAIKERVIGPEHVDVVSTLSILGRVRVQQGDLAAAARHLERGRALCEKKEGCSRDTVADVFLGLGEIQLAKGAPAEALPLLERAHALDPEEAAITLADTLWKLGKDRARAREIVSRVRAGYERPATSPRSP